LPVFVLSIEGLGAIVRPRTLWLDRRNERLNKILLSGVVSRHNGTCRLFGTQVDCFVWHARWNKEKVSSLADYLVFKCVAPPSEDLAFQDIDASLVPEVYVWLGLGAWWNDNEVHRQTCSSHSGARDANEVGQTLPRHYFAVWSEALYFAGGVVHGISNVSEWLLWRLTFEMRGKHRLAGVCPLD
jgi:hypothetical protein